VQRPELSDRKWSAWFCGCKRLCNWK